MDCMRTNFVDGMLLDGRFRTVAPLNHGSFGMVFKAYDTWAGEFVALKCLTKANAAFYAGDFAVDDRSEELVVHQRIGNHPNIIKLLHQFETEHHTYLVLEFCENGDLYEAIRVGRGPGRTEHVRQCMLQLVDAIEHMHLNGVYHRDVKPENIMLGKDGAIKLGDFGLATMDPWSNEAAVGSDRYMAPEQYDPATVGYSPAKADIWAIGICLLNVLFSRNPFAMPSFDDPLYVDFANDRQTLFDVFPTMSQDTFEVLTHCVSIDPAKRSLAAVRSALKRAVCFTTDDETLDDFCADDNVVVTATANRMPLRTPSVHTPQMDQGAFPWAKALAMTPSARQLSAIPDTELSESVSVGDKSSDWFAVKPGTASVASFVDSGLGVSFKSTELQLKPETARFNRSKPMPISGSLPITMGRPVPSMSAVFGKKRDLVSKSWSDLWDEEEEENAMHSDAENDINTPSRGRQAWRDEVDGHDTPRQGLSELKNPATVNNSRNRAPASALAEDHVSEHTGFVFEEHDTPRPGSPVTPASGRYSPPSKRVLSDKWAALGDRRRAYPTPTKSPAQPLTTPRKRSRASSWRARNIDAKPIKSPFSFVNDSTGVLDHYQRHLSSGCSGRAFTTSKAHNHQLEQQHPWHSSKDWRQHVPPQRDDAVEFLSGWRRGLHL